MSPARLENNTIIGTAQEIYKCLTGEYNIRPEKPPAVLPPPPAYYQLTPLNEQIDTIQKAHSGRGKIYYTKEICNDYGAPHSFEIMCLEIQIVD